jgi:hypothetical protein
MGLLDELRQKSEQLHEQEQQEQERHARAEESYRTQIKPALHKLYSTFGELIKHLNYIKPDILVPYTFNVEGLVVKLKQDEYRIVVDSTNDTKEVVISFQCVHPQPIQFVVRNKTKLEETLHFLKGTTLKYQYKPHKDEHHEITGGHFVIQPSFKVNFIFKADIENSMIDFTCSNFDGFGVRKYVFKPEKFTDEFIDQLGRHLVREIDLFKEDVAEDVKEQLRAKIAEEQQQRQTELEQAEKERVEEEERKRNEGGRFQFLKKFNLPKTG